MGQPAPPSAITRAGFLLAHIAAVFSLTILTQIGGIIWVLSLAATRLLGRRGRGTLLLTFIALHAGATLVANTVAPLAGRVPLPCFPGKTTSLAVASPIYCALNRNYVVPELADAARAFAGHMAGAFPGTRTLALDANFPFVAGLPLIPHLSHDDGRKLDLALYYEDADGTFRNGEMRSPIGYFAFQQPEPGMPLPCAQQRRRLTLRWDLNWLQAAFPDWRLEKHRMREALRWLSTEGQQHGIGKIFIEPHIPASLGVADASIRFQGCRAARHDDHIHIQLR